MIETDVYNLVIPTSSAIPAIASRLYIGSFPTSSITYPAAVMYSISRLNEMFDASLRTERLQFSIYADTLSSATDIADAIKTKVKGYYGETSTTYKVISINFDNMSYLYDDSVYKYVRILDMIIRYLEV